MVGPDSAIATRQALQAAKAERRELQARVKDLDRLIASLEQYLGIGGTERRPKRGGRRGYVKPAIIELLRDNGGVMHARDVVERLQSRGVQLSGRDPRATVVTALLRLAKEGNVEALGKNRYRWVGGPAESAGGTDQESQTTPSA